LVLISHRLTELAAISDRVAVIVDGRCMRQLEGADRTAEDIAATLVRGLGTTLAREATASPNGASSDDLGLELVALTDQKRAFQDLDFAVPKKTVTALFGVEGSGAREIVRACAGLRRVHGRVTVDGQVERPTRLHTRVSYVAADRAAGLFTNLSVGENLVIRLDEEISPGVFGIRRREMRAIANQLRTDFQIKSAGTDIGSRPSVVATSKRS
jgi:ABC-type sugar transport system ATPase subunit